MNQFFDAIVIGVTISIIFGPTSMLFIRKTLALGVSGAISVGTAISLGNTVYGMIICLGLTMISGFLTENSEFVKIVGGLFLLFLAVQEWRFKSVKNDEGIVKDQSSLFSLFLQTLFLTLVSPVTILFFISVFSSSEWGQIGRYDSFFVVTGIFLGSMIWWTIFGMIILIFKKRLSEKWLENSRYLSAIVLGGIGLWVIRSAVVALCYP